jgi:uncharacterized membrane protein
MKMVAKKIFIAGLMLLFFSAVAAKEYELAEIQINAAISATGTFSIEESRTYVFSGQFGWADYRLSLAKLGQIQNFRLYEGTYQFTESQDEQPGTYTVNQSTEEFYVRWYYQARNETRTFKLQYEITNAVVAYNDVAEFYYKFIGEDNPKSVARAEVWLELPQPADTSLVKAWAHGPLNGLVTFQDNRLHYYISPLPAHEYWETRVLFPAAWISGQVQRIDKDHMSLALEQETDWAVEANRQREQASHDAETQKQRAGTARQWSWFLCTAGMLFWLYLFMNYGKSITVPYTQEIDPNCPQDLPPAVVSALYYDKQIYASALSSTLFDLARRGFISLEQKLTSTKKWWQFKEDQFLFKFNRGKFEKEQVALLDYERDLILFLFDQLAGGADEITPAILKKKSGKVRSWFAKWSKIVKGHYKSIPLFDRESSKATVIAVSFSILIIICGIILAIFLDVSAFIAILGGVICLGLSFTIFRYTAEIKLKKKQWKAFRRYIKSYQVSTAGRWQQKMSTINQYLVYALALGVGEKELRNMLATVPEKEYSTYFPWFVASMHGGGTSPVGGLAATLSSVINVAGTTFSSAAGVGGGASAGAGAGAGGAAGGAG